MLRYITTVGLGIMLLMMPVFVRAQSANDEQILSFGAEYIVSADGVLHVTERIVYQFSSPRHGIFRDLPEEYVDEGGGRFAIPLEVESITDGAGVAVQYVVEKGSFGKRIRIGDPDTTVTGSHVYIITYTAVGALRYFDAHDELYWNVTGTEWDVPISTVSATVTLPATVGADVVRTACYTGSRGSRAEDCTASVRGSTAYFSADEPLTMVVGWPKGHVAVLEAPRPSALGTLALLLPLLLPIVVFVLMYRKWHRTGRDIGKQDTLVVQYTPPEGARPADVGVIIDETAHVHDITATIVDLAVRGYLSIRETERVALFGKKKDFELIRKRGVSDDGQLKSYEVRIMDVLFGAGKVGTTVVLAEIIKEYAFAKELPKIREDLYDEAVALGYFAKRPDNIKTQYRVVGILVIFFSVFFAMTVPGILGGNAMLAFMLLMSCVMSGIVVIAFAPLMAQKTAEGSSALAHAEGFREYLSRAEKYRLKWQEDTQQFEAYLPYAMVFEVVDKYTRAFKDIDLPKPDWYEGDFSGASFNAIGFATAMNGFSSDMKSAVLSAPSSSSSGSGFSGGSSGGGGGGGGGGSW